MKYKGSLTADSKVRRDLDRAGGYGIRLVALARPQRGNTFHQAINGLHFPTGLCGW